MTNEEKYKTAIQLNKAFSKYCHAHTCDNCKHYKSRGRGTCYSQFVYDEAEQEIDDEDN